MAKTDKRGKKRPFIPDGIAVALVSGTVLSIVAVADTPETFEDTSFVTGDSPATLDINAALGRNATQ